MSSGVCLQPISTSLVVVWRGHFALALTHTDTLFVQCLCQAWVPPSPCRYDGGDFSGGEDNIDDFEDVQVSIWRVQLLCLWLQLKDKGYAL